MWLTFFPPDIPKGSKCTVLEQRGNYFVHHWTAKFGKDHSGEFRSVFTGRCITSMHQKLVTHCLQWLVTVLFHGRVAPCRLRRNITVLKPMSWWPFMLNRTHTEPAFSKRQTLKTAQRALNICTTAEPERLLTHQSSNAILKIEVMGFNIQLTMVFSLPLRQHPVPLATLPQQFMSCGSKNCSEKKSADSRETKQSWSPFERNWSHINYIQSRSGRWKVPSK